MRKIIHLLVLLSLVSNSYSQINLDNVLTAKINATPQLQQRSEKGEKYSATGKITRFSRIKSIDYTIDAGEAILFIDSIVYLPEQYIIKYYSNKNCSDDRRGWTQNITLTVTQGQTLEITRSVTASKSNTYTFGVKIPIPKIGGELSGSTSSTISLSTTTTQATTQNLTKEESVSKTINLEVAAHKSLYVKFQTTNYTMRVPFQANLFANGFVTVEDVIRVENAGSDFETILNEVRIPIETLLSKEARTFSITGFLENSKCGTEEVYFSEKNIPADSCTQNEPKSKALIAVTDKIENNKKLTKKDIESLNKLKGIVYTADLGDGKAESKESIEKMNLEFKKNKL